MKNLHNLLKMGFGISSSPTGGDFNGFVASVILERILHSHLVSPACLGLDAGFAKLLSAVKLPEASYSGSVRVSFLVLLSEGELYTSELGVKNWIPSCECCTAWTAEYALIIVG